MRDLLPPAPEPLHDRTATSTRDFLYYLLAGPPPGLSLVVTFRAEEVDPSVPALTARLPPQVSWVRLALAPLDVPQTGALAAAILGADEVSAEFAAYLCERASGLPFAV